ncbi:MAG: hypothetical protein A2176_11455 [Spirochaetes bacterium RBG_13_51_14]|nr:MAG: hypothetical protein A2176_11455 [Spirochaetes bacterium RBG_13_51_14]
MNKSSQDTLLVEKIIDRYKLSRPVPPNIQDSILSSKKRILVRVLKTVGVFTAVHGVFLSIYFAVKKTGIGIPLIRYIISGIAVISLTYGAYYASVAAYKLWDPGEISGRKTLTLDDIRAQYKWIDQITLYNGRIIKGAIISRGTKYTVITTEGILRIPRKHIKMVKPLKTTEYNK